MWTNPNPNPTVQIDSQLGSLWNLFGRLGGSPVFGTYGLNEQKPLLGSIAHLMEAPGVKHLGGGKVEINPWKGSTHGMTQDEILAAVEKDGVGTPEERLALFKQRQKHLMDDTASAAHRAFVYGKKPKGILAGLFGHLESGGK